MKKRLLQYILLGCTLTLIFSACRKDAFDNTTETAQQGKTFVWIDGAPETNQFFDVFTDVKPINLFVLRRNAANTADLQKAITVKLTALPQSYLDNYGGGYTAIVPTDIYTMPTAADIASGGAYTGSEGITKTADGLTVSFAAGEFAKNIYFKVDGSKVDLSKQYAAAFAISDFGGFTKKVGYDTVVSTIAIKNKYDGIYTITGNILRYTSATDTDPALSGDLIAGLTTEVATLSANSNSFNQYWAPGSSVGGIAGLQLAVDAATNKVTVTASGNATLANTPGGDNSYDPATKTFHLAFQWGASAAAKRVAVTTLVYKSSR